MNLMDFLHTSTQSEFPPYSRVIFHGKDHSTLFLTKLYLEIKKYHPFGSIDAESCSLADAKAQLSMSFLGNRMIYGIKNSHTLDAVAKKAWNSYLKEYQGPHCILFFTSAASGDDSEGDISVELPEKVDAQLYRVLYTFFYNTESDQYFLEKLFYGSDTLSLDEACLMMSYQMVVGRKCDLFFMQWFSRLIIPQKSFFNLSQYFFAQQPKQFLEQWKSCRGDLPDEFWIAYWSEQLWQAALFVLRARNQGIVEAKKGAFRLPFSFINKDWQKYTSEMLIGAHTALAQLDYALKNGAGTHGLELWYHRFLKSSS